MQEEWRAVVGYEGYYQVSNIGRVRSINRIVYHPLGNKNIKGRILKNGNDSYGYLIVVLSKDGHSKTKKIHTLVANAFIENVFNLPQINHIDENKHNNNVSNLERCTAKYNNNFGSRIERARKSNTNGKKSKEIVQLLNGIIVATFPSAHEAVRKLGYGQGHINECCRGERKTHMGYQWKFKEDIII